MTTDHEVFTQAKTHLLTQNERCVNEHNNCSYRNDNGLKCAVGALIADEFYSPDLEGLGMVGSVQTAIMSSNPGWLFNFNLLKRLREIHDNKPIARWGDELDKLEYDFFFKKIFMSAVTG